MDDLSSVLADLTAFGAVAAMPYESLLPCAQCRWLVMIPDFDDRWKVGTMAHDEAKGWALDGTVGIWSGLTWRQAKRTFSSRVHDATRF